MNESHNLLQEYRAHGSEGAFHELVRRYIDLVYSVAIRRVGGDEHAARDIIQTVFTDLARKTATLPPNVQLGGWLHRHTCFVTASFVRSEQRRRAREQEATHMKLLEQNSGEEASWDEVSPFLDEAIQDLESSDRDAIVLRFFERRDLKAVGANFGISEDAAQKRVSRAVDRLRGLLAERGVALPGTVLGAVLMERAMQAAPTDWVSAIADSALSSVPAKLGLAAGVAALLSPAFLKLGGIGVAAALIVGAVLWRASRTGSEESDRGQVSEQAGPSRVTPSVAESTPTAPAATAPDASPTTTTVEGESLRLVILSAETGQPIANGPVERQVRQAGKYSRDHLVSDEAGVCTVPVIRDAISELKLTTQIDGFADTRILWNCDRGDRIPESYTIRLERADPIGGRVINQRGEPVASAQVGFNHREDPASGAGRESHHFTWIAVKTDGDGRWKINHIARELLGRIYGSAEHPEYVRSEAVFLDQHAGALELLRAETHTFVLGDAVVVRGWVTDADTNPLPNVSVLAGMRGEGNSREATTALDGTFAIEGCRPGKLLLTAEESRFSPTVVQIDARPDGEPVHLILSRGKILKMRVVNRQGQGIPGAQLWLQTHSAEVDAPPMVQSSFNPRTDQDGRVTWDQAPDRELMLDIHASGYMRTNEVRVHPDGMEHTIVMNPALRIRGTVRNAATGEPVPRFRIITGRPERYYPLGPNAKVLPSWSNIDRFWLNFAEGKFDHTFEETVVYNESDPKFLFKIEAEGFTPHITRVVDADEGEATFDVQLKPASAVKLTVLLPNGQPATRTDVLFARPLQSISIGPTGFGRDYGAQYQTTDANGQLAFQPDESIIKVYAANEEGFGEATVEALTVEPTLRLGRWASVEGTFTRRGPPIEGRQVMLSPPPMFSVDGRSPEAPHVRMARPVETDAQGRYSIPKVAPGKYQLGYMVPDRESKNTSTSERVQEFEIAPGEKLEINWVEEGAEVLVTALWPAGLPRDPGVRLFAGVSTPQMRPPAEIMENIEAIRRWYQQPHVQEQMRNARNWRLEQQPNGRWKGGLVPPGRYTLVFSASVPVDHPNKPLIPLVHTVIDIEIPEETDEVDLGEVALQKYEPTAPQP